MNKIKLLEESLIYQMSLGSKELYHSNVWAWLIELDHAFIKAFGFDDSYVPRVKRVGREEGDRDISIYLDDIHNGPVIVIENKLKSIPGIEQLRKYQTGLGSRFLKGILTGIVLPTIADETQRVKVGDETWDFLDYQSLSNGIMGILKTTDSGPIVSNRLIIEEYCRNIVLMDEIVSEKAAKNIKPLWDGNLDNLGLQDLINKVKASQFMRFFDDYIKEKSIDFGPSFEHGHGFHNKKNTIDFRFVSQTDEGLRIGIQIEGDQFRRFAQLRDDPGNKQFDESVFSEFKDIWFDGVFFGHRNDDSRRIAWPGMNSMKLGTKLTHSYGQYRVKGDYCFVYQYATLDGETFEYDSLVNLIIGNLTLARGLFEDYLAKHNQ